MKNILLLVWVALTLYYLWWWFRVFLNMWVMCAQFTRAGCLFVAFGGGVFGRAIISLVPVWNILLGLIYWLIEKSKLGNVVILPLILKYDVGLVILAVIGWLISLIPQAR